MAKILREFLSTPNLTVASSEAFQILQSFNYTVMLYDEDNNRVEEPEEARRLFAKPNNLMVTLTDDGENSTIKLIIGKSTQASDVLDLITALRTLASKYNLLFNVRQSGKAITPMDFATESVSIFKESKFMNVFEGMYGTSRSSYLQLENARMIVRHSGKIDETKMGARARRVESIFVENDRGERFLFPTNQMAPARAMTQHVSQGGSFADLVGQQISRMAQDYSALSQCSRHVYQNMGALSEGAHDLREACRCKMRKMKKTFESLYRPNGYAAESARISEAASTLTEGGEEDAGVAPEKLDELRTMLTVEGREALPDAVLERVEIGLSEDADAMVARKGAYVPKEKPATVSVFGITLDKASWDSLRSGDIDLTGEPDIKEGLRYADGAGELLFKFDAVIEVVRDPSLANFLTRVADALPNVKDPERKRTMLTIAKAVLKAAGVKMGPESVAKTPAVREFIEWIDKHNGVVTLNEGDDMDDDEGDHGDIDENMLLTREDILLPPEDEGESLKNEIKPSGKTAELLNDEEDFDRMMTLAGRHHD